MTINEIQDEIVEEFCELDDWMDRYQLLIVGPTTGALYVTATDIHGDNGPIDVAKKGMRVAIPVPEKVRPSDKLYKIVKA